jgi:hypothetical protein
LCLAGWVSRHRISRINFCANPKERGLSGDRLTRVVCEKNQTARHLQWHR